MPLHQNARHFHSLGCETLMEVSYYYFFNLLICNFRINFSTLNEIVNGMKLAILIITLGVNILYARFMSIEN
jgi:hypothetical protein